MKKLNLVAYAAFALLIFYGCKKSGSSSPKVSTWTFAGKNYTGKRTIFFNNSYSQNGDTLFNSRIVSSDSNGNSISVILFSKVSLDGIYTIEQDPFESLVVPSLVGSSCSVLVSIPNNNYGSPGNNGNVILSISGGKQTATCNSIKVLNDDSASEEKTVSATLIEQ